MSTAGHDLSSIRYEGNGDHSLTRVTVVSSKWHNDITGALTSGALAVLEAAGLQPDHIKVMHVPGSFELPLGARLAFNHPATDAVICLGCVIQGETRHFDFICHAVADGIMQLNLSQGKPVIFGVLTTDTLLQAQERAGGRLGNKGAEAAVAALEMIDLSRR